MERERPGEGRSSRNHAPCLLSTAPERQLTISEVAAGLVSPVRVREVPGCSVCTSAVLQLCPAMRQLGCPVEGVWVS